MKNLLFSTIKYGSFVGIGFGALVHTAFAAAVITPVTVTEISRTEAVVQAKVDNLGMYSAAVWFEWGETSTLEKPVAGMKDISVSGYFEHRFVGLKEVTTYYTRAAVMDSKGNTVYSPVTTFTTGTIIPAPVVKKQEPAAQEQAVIMPTIVKKTDTMTSAKKETSETSAKNIKKETPAKKTVTTTTATSSAQSASLLGIGGEVFPQTLIGWLVLFIVVLVIVLLVHMIYDTNQKRKKAIAKIEQEAKIKAEMQKK